MKKRLFAIITCLMSISAFGMAMTADAAGNKLTYGELTYNNYGGWIEITGCDTSAEFVEIPEKIDGTTVRDIGESAFSGCSNLAQITIPDCVENIKDSAFRGCTALTTIDLPENLVTIGFNAFGESGLTEIMIPETVNFIDRFAFSHTPITTIAISKNVETIGDRVFYDCSNLAEITVDEGNASFISNDGVLFSYDQSELLCYPAAKEDKSYTMPETVTTLYSGAFYGCENLVNITISENVTVIPEWAFYYCRGLKEITIPEFVTKLDTGACYSCINLTSVYMSNNITNISVNAFGQCSSLTDVYYTGTEEEWKAIDISKTMGMNDTLINANIHYNYKGYVEQIKGDVNADGVFSVADVILLQKWLLTVPDTNLANWKAADFYEDGKLDVFDLCLMKRMLIYGDVPPMTVPTQVLNFSGRYPLSDKVKSLMSDEIRELTDNSDLDDFTFESRICSNIVDDDYNFIGERYVFGVYYKDLILNPDIYSLEIQYYYDDNINIYGDFLNTENINKVLTADLNFYQSEQDIIKTGRDYCEGLAIPTEDSYGYDLGFFNPSSTFGDRIRKMIYSLDDVTVSYEITDSNYGYEYIENVKNGYVDLSTDMKIYIDAQTGEIIIHNFNVIMGIS